MPAVERDKLPAERRALLDLKSRLGVLGRLHQKGRLAPEDELVAWLELREPIRRAVPP